MYDSQSNDFDDNVNPKNNEKLTNFVAESGLSAEDVPDWQWVTNAAMNHGLGRVSGNRVKGEGIEIPYYTLAGEPIVDQGTPFKRYRLLSPEQGGAKYLSRAGSSAHAYIPHGLKSLIERTGDVPDHLLVICEGEKKAARLVKLGIPAIAIAGIQMWPESSIRNRQKAEAEQRGEKPPRLSRSTPVASDIRALITELAIKKVVILFDSDGLPVDAGTAGITEKFVEVSGGKLALNRDVFWSARTFAAALKRSCPRVAVAYGFAPHMIGDNGALGRQGIDDWSLTVSVDELHAYIDDIAAQARELTPGELAAEEQKAEREERLMAIMATQGFVPLGYSSGTESTTYYVWSKYLSVVKSFTDASLARKSAFYGVFGEEFCDEILGKEIVIQRADEQRGIPEIRERRFDLDRGQRAVTAQCAQAGRWSPESSVRGAGVWDDDQKSGLIVNCADGLHLVKNDGGEETIERIRGRFIYESTARGAWSDKIASEADVMSLIATVQDSWNWRRESDGALFAGWLLAQAYTGALRHRPGVMINGESGCGKSYLEEWSKKLLGKWGLRIEETRGTSLAGVSQLIKHDSLTLFLDEVEPKSGTSAEEAARVNRTIDAIRQMLRAAYSRSDDEGSYGAVKGSASQEAVAREVRVMTMIASIAEHDVEQADRNRNLRLGLRRFEIGADGKPTRRPPALPDDGQGAALFRLMWSRWRAFSAMLESVFAVIAHREERMRLTLAVPLAALLTGLGITVDAPAAQTLIAQINSDYSAADEDAPRDQDRALQRLLAAVIDVGGTKRAIAAAMGDAVDAGAGRAGRDAGGAAGDALKLHGLTVRLNSDGSIALFVAARHPGVEALGRQVGIAGLAGILSAVDGAEKAGAKRGGADTRVRIFSQNWSGVWVPTSVSVADADKGEVIKLVHSRDD